MTQTEKKKQGFANGDEVFILDKRTWVKGEVLEVGDETILIQRVDLKEPTEYELSDLPDIRHLMPPDESYWEKRCKAAEKVLITKNAPRNEPIKDNTQFILFSDAYSKWQDIVNKKL